MSNVAKSTGYTRDGWYFGRDYKHGVNELKPIEESNVSHLIAFQGVEDM
jgi:hypothetical protein